LFLPSGRRSSTFIWNNVSTEGIAIPNDGRFVGRRDTTPPNSSSSTTSHQALMIRDVSESMPRNFMEWDVRRQFLFQQFPSMTLERESSWFSRQIEQLGHSNSAPVPVSGENKRISPTASLKFSPGNRIRHHSIDNWGPRAATTGSVLEAPDARIRLSNGF